MEKIRIGTRGSKLALWQAYYVEEKLKLAGLDTEIITIETIGDKILDVSIAKIGSKGVFTEEIEAKLLDGTIDIAVHSAKDMQSELPEPFELIAFTEREKVNDVLVSEKADINLEDKDLIIGTSSTRRVAMLKHLYPHIKTVPVRGNLQTRIGKMKDGACDALMLAYAGMFRMGYGDMIRHELPLDQFTPAVGQGSVAIECSTNLDSDKKQAIREALNHELTEYRLLCERAFLRKLQGGCSIPVFGLATLNSDEITFEGGIVSLDGKEIIRKSVTGNKDKAEELGNNLAVEVLEAGGDKILKEIKTELGK
ncbi:hydroxymethylbilane synthase [Fulvivirga lutimaris]|uniref:hydroxymethylbilane synthase n=1 Tax=Fulvivirga lutimaris TaxID=1819566 RepID=UPI0012BD794C|nr:hydroxymethylbilane synthase [Fulvivirga lutimaris]MTI39874.1 hydroxymethylbilane synthase [Fulvivirga lutimaris]